MTKTVNVCVVTVLFLNGICSLANSFLTDVNKSTILQLHNRFRRSFANGAQGVMVADMNKLVWSYLLEFQAARTLQCGNPISNVQGYGLNINIKTNSSGNFSSDIHSWYNELEQFYFSPEDGSCWPSYRMCLSAYSLLNAKHRRVGCAYRQNCPDEDNAFLCLYDGSGIPFYKAGSTCTKCDGDTSFCDNGLCVRCNPDIEQCDCRKTCNVPQIGLGVLNSSTCTCTCQYGMGPNCDERCENPENFEDYDICGGITADMCDEPDYVDMFAEFCPTVCSCSQNMKCSTAVQASNITMTDNVSAKRVKGHFLVK